MKLLWNYWIMTNYAGAVIWWLCRGSLWNAAYWVFAFGITFVVSFGLQPK